MVRLWLNQMACCGFTPSLAHPATSGGLGAGPEALELSQREGETFSCRDEHDCLCKGPGGLLDGREGVQAEGPVQGSCGCPRWHQGWGAEGGW